MQGRLLYSHGYVPIVHTQKTLIGFKGMYFGVRVVLNLRSLHYMKYEIDSKIKVWKKRRLSLKQKNSEEKIIRTRDSFF